MADRLVIDGYGQVELNNVAFRRDGRIEAQCKLGKKADGKDIEFVENGMILAVDNVTRTVVMPKADGTDKLLALNYSAEHIYDERTPGLKNFKLEKNSFLPRLGYLAVGDKFTTNCIATEMTVDAMKAAVKTGLYGCEDASGAILVSASAPTGKKIVLQAVAATTMPDGQFGLKFQVLAC